MNSIFLTSQSMKYCTKQYFQILEIQKPVKLPKKIQEEILFSTFILLSKHIKCTC